MERVEALRLFRGNGEDVIGKLKLLESQLPSVEKQKPCLDAELEVNQILFKSLQRNLKRLIGEAEAWEADQVRNGESVTEYKLTPSLVQTPWNQRMTQDPDYLNPLIVEKMLDHFDLDELGTNFQRSEFETTDFYEELAKRQTENLALQQEEMMRKRRQQEAVREKLVETRA